MTFVSTENKGVGMTFENGFGISVQWGTMNYCEKKNLGADGGEEMKTPRWESRTAEIAIYKDGKFIDIGDDNDTVIGWLSPDEVAKLITIVPTFDTTENEIREKIKYALYDVEKKNTEEGDSDDVNIFGKISSPQYKELIEGYQNKTGKEFNEWYKLLPNEERVFLSSMFD